MHGCSVTNCGNYNTKSNIVISQNEQIQLTNYKKN